MLALPSLRLGSAFFLGVRVGPSFSAWRLALPPWGWVSPSHSWVGVGPSRCRVVGLPLQVWGWPFPLLGRGSFSERGLALPLPVWGWPCGSGLALPSWGRGWSSGSGLARPRPKRKGWRKCERMVCRHGATLLIVRKRSGCFPRRC